MYIQVMGVFHKGLYGGLNIYDEFTAARRFITFTRAPVVCVI